jgi:hypothetical protein
LAVTVHVVPLPVTVPIVAPLPVRLKFDAFKPVTLLLNVTVHETVAALVGLVPARLIDSTFAAIAYASPVVNGRLPTGLVSLSATPVELSMLIPTDPVAVPTVTGIVHVVPLPVGVPTVAPVEPVPVIPKFAAVNPVTGSLNVTV